MTFLEIFYKVLEAINFIAIGLCTLGFVFQIFYIIFMWLKPKSFPKAKTYRKIAIIIPACNEESVIGKTVKELLTKQTYPKDKYDVFVCADNCKDKTAQIAKVNGAIVYERFDDEPSHKRASYAIKFIIEKIFLEHDEYEAFIKFDADNLACPEYIEKMNDALEAGVEVARAFEASTNATQNAWTKVSAGYYIRDSRIACNFRERAHLDSMLSGAGMMFTTKIIKENGGWDALSTSDDSEFTCKRMLQKVRIHYVADAVVYEDQPSSLKDTFNRNARMAHGLHAVFWKYGFKMLPKFFTTGNFSYIDLFVQLMFIPIALVGLLWFPAYYIFYAILHLLNWIGPNAGFLASMNVGSITGNPSLFTAAISQQTFINLLWMAVMVLGSLYALYSIQTWLSLELVKKKINLNKHLKGYWTSIFLSPIFMLIYAVAVVAGVLSKPKWKQIKRNTSN